MAIVVLRANQMTNELPPNIKLQEFLRRLNGIETLVNLLKQDLRDFIQNVDTPTRKHNTVDYRGRAIDDDDIDLRTCDMEPCIPFVPKPEPIKPIKKPNPFKLVDDKE
jgi:hypothetical protein